MDGVLAKGKQPLHVDLTINESTSDDGSSEDTSYVPVQEGSSSIDEELVVRNLKPNRKEAKKVQKNSGMAKGKEKIGKDNIMQADDAIVEDLSDVEVDLGFVGTPGEGILYEALDPGAESDGANSWHSEEMKTPPNSEDELESDGDSDEFPIFQGGQRFGELRLQVGMKFNTKQEFKDAVREFTIQVGRGIKFVKNDNTRCRAVCQVEECSWIVYASRDHEDCCWQIKTFYDDYTCPRENSNRATNRTWLAGKLVKKSDEKAQYALTRDYAETLLKINPGFTVKIGVIPLPDGQVMFEKMYVCLSDCKNGFRSGCRPLIGLDGAFLKTQIAGQILSAIAQDTNHHIYVIAWAIVNVENKENWKWFLELLHDDLGDYKANGWCFISDMQKGLISAIEEVMPQVHHRFCVWHLWQNFNKQWKDLELRRLLWDAARSTTFQDFIDNMDKIKKVSEEAWTYLNKWPRHSWTKSQFSHQPKLDNICNNACEVFNARIKEARSKPIITLLEEVRMFVMRSIAKNKVKLNNYVGKLPPVIQSRLEKVRKESKNWVPI
ncbi:uncharacterized protein LOC107647289 [Arachis ipaensis]|uniref:uncharacterized protein LOC107647289 n=1 Tax=Arachis ipaensis TaxID=130454 RepID=UPI0007AFA102|nr:uncharacterized protein LOC107647289 [Arachis ipaensis]XP_025661897.1 uncharacterized protein LOC112757544 [Arachis hypogaea]